MAGKLFNKAKAASPKKSKKNDNLTIVINDVEFHENIKELEKVNNILSENKAKADMIGDEIKDKGREEWSKLYDEIGKNPGTVILESTVDGEVAQVMFITQDKYISINEERAEELREEYGNDIVTEETVFAFDSKMVEKYGEILSELILNSTEIAEEDKEKIITAKTSYSVAKGTIDKMSEYGSVSRIVEDIRPIVSLKNAELIKG
jgi:hypothetical protein